MICLILLLLLFGTIETFDDRLYYKKLRSKLLTDYDPTMRPVKNRDKILDVKTMAIVARLLNVNIRRGHVEIDFRIHMSWKDEYLVWSPDEFGNISKLYLHPEEIWTPELLAEHKHYLIHGDSYWSFPLVVNNSGTVDWTRSVVLPMSCEMNLAEYPADTHECYLGIYLKHYAEEKLRFKLFSGAEKPLLYSKVYMANPEFNVDYVNSSIVNQTYAVSPPYEDHYLGIYMEIQRRASTYMYKMVVPYIMGNLFMLYSLLISGPLGVRILSAAMALNIDVNLFTYTWTIIGTPGKYGIPYAVKCVTINMTLVVIFIVLIILSDNFVARNRRPCPNLIKSLVRSEIVNKILFFRLSLRDVKDLNTEISRSKQVTSIQEIGDWTVATIFLNRIYLLLFLLSLFIYHF